MTGKARGWLLLTSHLGNPDRKVLTAAQVRSLFQRLRGREAGEKDRDLQERDLLQLGYGRELARHILSLLEEEELLDHYLRRGKQFGCVPVTRDQEAYPALLRRRLGPDAPGCLWVKGDVSLLKRPAISLVGSRELKDSNREFAAAVGRHAAREGLVLVSGNARGADRAAQESCLRAGGQVLSIIADDLSAKPNIPGLTFVSLEDFDAPFSAQRALHRNHSIHALGAMVFVAQTALRKGGTWDGTAANLRANWSSVVCFDDGSEGVKELEAMGAYPIGMDAIPEFILPRQDSFL